MKENTIPSRFVAGTELDALIGKLEQAGFLKIEKAVMGEDNRFIKEIRGSIVTNSQDDISVVLNQEDEFGKGSTLRVKNNITNKWTTTKGEYDDIIQGLNKGIQDDANFSNTLNISSLNRDQTARTLALNKELSEKMKVNIGQRIDPTTNPPPPKQV